MNMPVLEYVALNLQKLKGTWEDIREMMWTKLHTEIAISKSHGAGSDYLKPWEEALATLERLGPERMLKQILEEHPQLRR